MPDNKLSQEQMYALLQYASRKLNTTPAQLASALQQGGLENLSGHLSPENAAKLQIMMGDKARALQILNSPQAQALIRKILEK